MLDEIEILQETESSGSWAFDVRVFSQGRMHDYKATLSWSDYDLWSHGRVGPSRVIRAVFEFLLANEPATAIMPHFDCAMVRRYFPKVDEELPGLI